MAKAAKIERTQKLFLKAMKEKFAEDPQATSTVFAREGLEQSPRKVEFMKAGKKAEMDRGISMYDPKRCHCGGIPLGQRQLMTYEVSGTGVFVEGDDLHFVNNAAMQQMWDDIRRTIIVGLDLAHNTLQKRLGKEVTPETINEYLHVLNHAMPGAAVVQEHMVETHPSLVDDCYVKVFTGDDEMADDLEPQFVLNLDKLFPAKSAAALKAAVGKSMWQAVHIPTTVSRTCDGGTTSRWSAMQIGMSFIGAYKMCAGEAAVADLAFAAKHAGVIQMADILPARRARGPNEPGGIKFGHFADMIQADRKYPNDPVKATLEVVGAGAMLFDQIWLGSYMSGGVGFTQYATAAYTDNILDDYCYYGLDYIKAKHGGIGKAKKQPRKSSTTSQPSHPLRYGTVRTVPHHPREPLRRIPACIRPCSSIRYLLFTRNGKLKRRPERLVHVHARCTRKAGHVSASSATTCRTSAVPQTPCRSVPTRDVSASSVDRTTRTTQ
jgi:methyl-coenzyme M reductase alpha subunit